MRQMRDVDDLRRRHVNLLRRHVDTVRSHVDMKTYRRNSTFWRRFYDENSEIVSSCSFNVLAVFLCGKL